MWINILIFIGCFANVVETQLIKTARRSEVISAVFHVPLPDSDAATNGTLFECDVAMLIVYFTASQLVCALREVHLTP